MSVPSRCSEPVTPIGDPPGEIGDRNGRSQRPPKGQNKICRQAEAHEDSPKDFTLHRLIVVGVTSRPRDTRSRATFLPARLLLYKLL